MRYTVLVQDIAAGAFRLTVRELPGTWTVAFDRDDIESRARERIAHDTGRRPSDFAIDIERPPLHIERRTGGRPPG